MATTQRKTRRTRKVQAPAHSARSIGVMQSWKDPDVALKRSVKDNVVVAGHGEYRSVKQAFEDLGLPLGKHAKFRLELKEKSRATFKDDGNSFKFRIVHQS